MRYLYTLLLYLALPLVLARLFWRGFKAPDYRRRWPERLGLLPTISGPPCIWIHAVSVGETRAALPLIRALLARYPERPLLVTTTTPTGSRQVRAELGSNVRHGYVPYDLPDAVMRFLRRARPALAIIMETELWPNLFHHCHRRRIPLIVANARLSPRSARGYTRVPGLTAATLACATRIAAQSEADAARFIALGAAPKKVQVMGNIKYDLTLPEDLPPRARALRQALGKKRLILLGASTHVGEDEALLEVYGHLHQGLPELLLLLVPRHPERFASVAELCRRRGLRTLLRSQDQRCGGDTRVFVGDTMGELLLFYAVADIAFVGGSLVPVGGHNVLEPALLGVPVLFGPYMFNFAEASERLIAAGAAWQVTNTDELTVVCQRLLNDPRLRRAAGEKGQGVVQHQRGALTTLLALVAEQLDARPTTTA